MKRRNFLAASAAAAARNAMQAQQTSRPKFGIDLFSIRSAGWSPFEYLDYCAKWKADVVHFSEVRFLGGLEDSNVRKVGEYAKKLGIELEIGMTSLCPTSTRFKPEEGTAEEQVARMIRAAEIAGSKIVRAFLGSSADRKGPIPIEGHIENTVQVLRKVRSRAQDAGVKIAIENHSGDMQARELKTLIEGAGPDFVGACVDSGNPVWTIEDPHLTLETLAPYALTSHIRDSAVWRTANGAAVRWVRTGEGNVNIDDWVRKYTKLCPGRAVTMEVIVTGAREFPYFKPEFWEGYRNVPAWEFSRFVSLVDKGSPAADYTRAPKQQRARAERDELEASIRHVQRLLAG